MKIKLLTTITFFTLLFFNKICIAQNNIRVNVQVLPPYSQYLSDYQSRPGQIVVTLTNISRNAYRLQLKGSIIGDNNVEIRTKANFKSPTPISINALETKRLSSADIQLLFDDTALDFQGITADDITRKNTLPEGLYQICVQAADYVTGQELSAEEPQGCSAPFNLQSIEPPYLIKPAEDEEIIAQTGAPQNIIFSWSTPASAPPSTKYRLKIVEFFNPSQNPQQVFLSGVTFLERENFPIKNGFLLGPADPQLQRGRKYIVGIQAFDPFGKTVFRNNGLSDLHVFTYGALPAPVEQVEVTSAIKLLLPANNAAIIPKKETGVEDKYEFSWEPPKTVPKNTVYALVVTKIGENENKQKQTPEQALKNNPAFFYKKIVNGAGYLTATTNKITFAPKFFYGFPSGEYAWKVVLLQLGSMAAGGANNADKTIAESNVFTFKENTPQVKIAGNIKYRMGIYADAMRSKSKISKFGNEAESSSTVFPLADAQVKLILSYAIDASIFEGLDIDKSIIVDGKVDMTDLIKLYDPAKAKAIFPDYGKVLASVTTSPAGDFSSLLKIDLSQVITNNDFSPGTPVKLYKIIKPVPADPENRYSIADGFFFGKLNPTPENSKNVDVDTKNIVLRALTFKLLVKLADLPYKKYLGNDIPPENTLDKEAEVYVLRKNKLPSGYFPLHEGDDFASNETVTIGGISYEVISKRAGKFGNSTPVSFPNLVRNKSGYPDDKFYIYAKLKGTKEEVLEPQEFKSTFKWKSYYFYNFETQKGSFDGNEAEMKFFAKEYDEHDTNGDNTNELSLKANKLTNTSISGVLKSHWACNIAGNNKTDKPLANTTVTLKSYYAFKPDGQNIYVDMPNFAPNWPTKTYGTVKTSDNGNFNFNINIGFTGVDYEKDSDAKYSDNYSENGLGWVQKDYTYNGPGPNGIMSNVKGTVYKVLKLLVDNPYVTSPDDAINVSAGYSYNIGTFLANVREADVTVAVKTFTETNPKYNKPLAGSKVFLCRKLSYNNVNMLGDEGNINTVNSKQILSNGWNFKVLAEGKTGGDGKVYFSRLVKSQNTVDRYYVIVKDDENGDTNYDGIDWFVPGRNCPKMSATGFNDETSTFNAQEVCWAGQNCWDWILEADPMQPIIAGAVYPKSNTSFDPIAGATVKLYSISETGFQSSIKPFYIAKSADDDEFSDKMAAVGEYEFTSWGVLKLENEQTVADNGKFKFENLVKLNGKEQRHLIWVKKKGFLDQLKVVNAGAPLTLGQKANLGSVFLRLPVNVTARVVDYDDETIPVKVKAIVGDNYSWAQSVATECNTTTWLCQQDIVLKCPRGKIDVTFYPEDADNYLPTTITINVPAGVTDFKLPYKVQMASKKHRISFLIKEKGTTKFPKIVKVELINTAITGVKSNATSKSADGTTMTYGSFGAGTPKYDPVTGEIKSPPNSSIAPYIEFKSANTKFTFRFSSNGYVSQEKVIPNIPTDYFIDYDINLEPAGMVSGIVKGPNSQPVKGAKVYFDGYGGLEETTTDSQGKYELNNIPLNKNITLKASLINFIGEEKTLDTTPKTATDFQEKIWLNGKQVTVVTGNIFDQSKANQFTLNFNLTEINDIDLTKIAGFPVEITKAEKSGTGYKVAGRFTELPENAVFSYSNDKSVSFHNLEIMSTFQKFNITPGPKFSGKAPASLKTNGYLDDFGLNVKLFKKVSGAIIAESFSGLEMVEPQAYKGAIKGSASGNISAFPSGIEQVSESNTEGTNFGLVPKNGATIFPIFTADKTTISDDFKVKHAFKNAPYKFKLHGYYLSDADMESSTFSDGILQLNTTIHTNLEHFADGGDIKVNVGNVKIDTDQGVKNVFGTKQLIFNLGKAAADKGNWSIESSNWTFGKGGLILKKGILNTGIGVQFTDMLVTDKKLLFGKYNTTGGLTLGNGIPLSLESTASLSFGYDDGYGDGAWALSILPGAGKANCASFTGLPGINGSFQISNVKTFSTGDMQIGLNTFAPVQVYNKTAIFRPATINVADGFVRIWGDLDYEIPNLPIKEAYALEYFKEGGSLKMQPKKRNFTMEINGIKASFPESDAQTLDASGLTLSGNLIDKDPLSKYNFKVLLKKSASTGGITLETIGENKFYVDPTRGLEHVKGNMAVQGDNRWNNFSFGGKMFGYTGVKPDESVMNFVVKGDIEADPQNKIGVSDIDTPLGGMSFVYDVKRSAFVGTLAINQPTSGCKVAMDLEMFLGSADWYLFGSGAVTLPEGFPISTLQAAFLVGDFRVPQLSNNITGKFSQFTWNKKLPKALSASGEGGAKGIQYSEKYIGIVLAGGFSMPIPKVPEINLNLGPIAHASLTHNIHANAVIGLNFATKAIMLDVNIGAAINLSVGASVGIGCASLDLNVTADVYANGLIQVAPLYYEFQAGALATISGSYMFGGGLCDSDCDGYFCVTTSGSKSLSLGIDINYKKGQDPKFDFAIK